MLNNSWAAIQTNLQKRLNPGIYQVWIKPLSAECSSQAIRLTAPNSFVASWVRDRLLETIRQAAEETLDSVPEISVQGQNSQQKAASPPRPVENTAKKVHESRISLPILPQTRMHTEYAWRFSFDDFVVGQSNEMAFMASHNFATQTFASDQLFLSSAPGLGKTHLIQAIGQSVAKTSNRDSVKTIYLTAEEFANQMVHALKSRTIDQFKAVYRDHTDILLLEDINFLGQTRRGQYYFFSV